MRSKPCLTLEDCRKISAACEAEAKKNKWIVSIAILDDGGHVLMLTRMDGAAPVTAQIATEKGRSAAVSRRSTKVSEDRIAAGRVALLKMPVLPVHDRHAAHAPGRMRRRHRRVGRAIARG